MPENFPPVAALKISNAEITLPDNKFTLDASGSTDKNPKAQLSFLYTQVSGPACKILNTTSAVTDVEASADGTAVFQVLVTDRGGKSDTATASIVIKPAIVNRSTIWLAKITQGSFAEQDKALKAMGLNAVRPTGITLSTYRPGERNRTREFLEAGYTCIVNLNWDNPTSGTVVPFYDNAANYAKQVEVVLQDYKPWIDADKIIFVIENEQTNRGYFSGPIEMYIALFEAAINMCAKYNARVMDGGLAAEYVDMIVNGELDAANARKAAGKDGRYDEQIFKTDKLIQYFKTVAYSRFEVNIHFMAEGTVYTRTNLPAVCDYLRIETGHEVGNNEWHPENGTEALIYDVVDKLKAARVTISGIFDGIKGEVNPITDGNGNLTKFGIAYAQAVK